MRIRSAATIAFAAGLTASAAAQSSTPLQVRYDFTLEVIENAVIGSSISDDNPQLAALTLGTTGTISVLASDIQVFPTQADSAWFQIDSISLQLGAIQLQGNPAFYGSSTNIFTAFRINDNAADQDVVVVEPVFESAPFFSPGIVIIDRATMPGQTPMLLDGLDIPTELDLDQPSVARRTFRFFATSVTAPNGFPVTSEITDVTITIIPAPATLALLTPAAALLNRRRR